MRTASTVLSSSTRSRLTHDFRQTALRDLERADVSRSSPIAATRLSEPDLSEGVKKLVALQAPERRGSAVHPLRELIDTIQEQRVSNQNPMRDHMRVQLLAKRESIVAGLQQVRWDLVDEAHRMSWTPPARKTARYALGEILRDRSGHILLPTATPHKGDPENFSRFLQLLDPDAYADVKSIREAMRNRSAPFYLRRTKEAMLYFPERQPDKTWKARKLFTKRDTRTANFAIDGEEYALYRAVTSFVKDQ